MIVVKIGGSLVASGYLKPCLDKIEDRFGSKNQTAILVPGGGCFADEVRDVQLKFDFDDRTAHQMALLAMQQMALLFKALNPQFKVVQSITQLTEQTKSHGVFIWSPDIAELDKAKVPSTWEMTSDSLSAWLAQTLGADALILVKSATIAETWDPKKLVEEQIVDHLFYDYTHQAPFKVTIVHAQEFLS